MSITEVIFCYASSTAIATVVTIAEILKNNGFAVEKSKTFAPPVNMSLAILKKKI